jgi:hypothetical protein
MAKKRSKSDKPSSYRVGSADVPGYSLLVRRSAYNLPANKLIRGALKRSGRKVSLGSRPKLAPNWPPPNWEYDICPVDDSPAAIEQWFECMSKALGELERQQRQNERTAMQQDGSEFVRDAYRLVAVLQQQGWIDAPKKPRGEHSFHDAMIELESVSRWYDGGSPPPVSPKPPTRAKSGRKVPEGKVKLGQSLQFDWLTYLAQGKPNDENEAYNDWRIKYGLSGDFELSLDDAKKLRRWFKDTHLRRHETAGVSLDDGFELSDDDKQAIAGWLKSEQKSNK